MTDAINDEWLIYYVQIYDVNRWQVWGLQKWDTLVMIFWPNLWDICNIYDDKLTWQIWLYEKQYCDTDTQISFYSNDAVLWHVSKLMSPLAKCKKYLKETAPIMDMILPCKGPDIRKKKLWWINTLKQ